MDPAQAVKLLEGMRVLLEQVDRFTRYVAELESERIARRSAPCPHCQTVETITACAGCQAPRRI